MVVIMSILGGILSVATKLGEYLVPAIKRQCNYLCCYSNNIEDLTSELKKLETAESSLLMAVDAAKRNVEDISPDVEDWLRRVREVKEEINVILEAQKSFLNEWCPDLKARYVLSKNARKMTKAVGQLQMSGKFGRVSYPAPLVDVDPQPIGTSEEFESRKYIEEQIMDSLKDNDVHRVCICGMGGVGKTRMAKRIGKRVKEENLFDEVVMAVVSETPELEKIQREIAEMLGLKLNEQTLSARARRLSSRTSHVKRILIILDDIWYRLDLETLGIPSGHSHKGCKILFTSRVRDVCTAMEAQKILTVGILTENEAWALFREKAGNFSESSDMCPIAKHVAKYCKGLPLAIITVGRALRNKRMSVWKDAHQRLQSATPVGIPGMLKDVYRPLELSYKQLEDHEAACLFLFCCFFPKDFNISFEDLVKYGAGLRMFAGVRNLEEARNRLESLVDLLKDRFLLTDGYAEGYVKMQCCP